MKPTRQKPNLDQAINDLKNSSPKQAQVDAAAARVWARVSSAEAEASVAESGFAAEPVALRGCTDFQALISRYLSGELARARVLLLEDHSSGCIDCRRAISDARNRDSMSDVSVPSDAGGFWNWRWAGAGMAAVLLIGIVGGGGDLVRQMLFPIDVHASAESVRGRLFRVGITDLEALAPGQEIAARESIRTASDSGAVLVLSDGSRIEMSERSELSLVPASDGIRINLERGSVIVEAASQGAGHLYVSTDDIDVVVVGTIFAVSEGTKGARVSVIEGEVLVEQGQTSTSVFPGEQFNSSSALTAVPIEEEIAWSEDREKHLELMVALAQIGDEIQVALASQGLRYSTSLLGLVPTNTLVYAAFPNVATTISTAYDVFSTRILENPVTREWWEQLGQNIESDSVLRFDEGLETVMGYLESFSTQIGDEIVVALSEGDEHPEFVVLTHVENPQLVVDVLRGIEALSGSTSSPLIVTSADEIQVSAGPDRPLAYVGPDGLLALGTSGSVLHEVIDAQQSGSAFQNTNFHQSLAAVYADGADWLFAADLDRLVSEANGEVPALSFLGMDSVDDLFVDIRTVGDLTAARAAMTFTQERSGVASWIAEAGPMGSLDFVSPDAYAVAAGLTRDVGAILADVFVGLQDMDPEAWRDVVAFQQEHRFDLQYDLASAFGGEFVLAMDGPILPTPSWKAVIEVYNSAALQNAIERLVFEFNRVALVGGQPQIELAAETSLGRVYHVLALGDSSFEIHYTYMGGYMIMAPSQALVTQATQYSETRLTLGNSTDFRALLPAGAQNYCSAILYENIGGLAGALSDFVPDSLAESEIGELDLIQDALVGARPILGCVVAEPNRIIAMTKGDNAYSVLTMGGIAAMLGHLEALQE
jgi:ferric-dicitrate binding protein FerR (iron transport regulator)